MALPDQLAPLLGSGAASGGAEAGARAGVDICSDDRLPAPPCARFPVPVTLSSWLNSSLFLKCFAPLSLRLDTEDQPTHARHTPLIGGLRVGAEGERAAEGALPSPPGPASDPCRVSFF